MKHRWILAVMCLLLCGGLVLARQGVVRTHDGQVVEGVIEEEADYVEVTSRGIVTRIQRENVASIEYPGSIQEQFTRRRAALEEEDVDGRVALARWAFEHREYRLAADLLDEALRIDANHQEARALMGTVRSQMRLERAPRPGDPERPIPDTPARPQVERHLLTPDQVNIIRQHELREQVDVNLRVRFEDDAVRRYVAASPMTMRQFNTLRPVEQARLLMAEPDFRESVRILQDPAGLAEFRRTVQPVILAGCAAAGCHGGPAGGDFILLPANGEAVSYTNFLILQEYTKQVEGPQTIFGGDVLRHMIDRTQPEESLLLQYGLPRNLARHPHPEVPGMRAPFASRDDRGYRVITHWISRSLSPVQPNYGIDFTPPRAVHPETPAEEAPAEPDEAPEDAADNGGDAEQMR